MSGRRGGLRVVVGDRVSYGTTVPHGPRVAILEVVRFNLARAQGALLRPGLRPTAVATGRLHAAFLRRKRSH